MGTCRHLLRCYSVSKEYLEKSPVSCIHILYCTYDALNHYRGKWTNHVIVFLALAFIPITLLPTSNGIRLPTSIDRSIRMKFSWEFGFVQIPLLLHMSIQTLRTGTTVLAVSVFFTINASGSEELSCTTRGKKKRVETTQPLIPFFKRGWERRGCRMKNKKQTNKWLKKKVHFYVCPQVVVKIVSHTSTYSSFNLQAQEHMVLAAPFPGLKQLPTAGGESLIKELWSAI